jgi:uncharacterized protein YggE
MDSKVTVSVRSMLLAGLLLLGLLVAYLLGSAGRPGAAPANAAEDQTAQATDRRTVVMSGRGEASAVPDQLSFGLSVGLTRTDLDVALADASAKMRRVLASLEDYGVEKADVQTTGLSMNPVYEYHESSPPTLIGYRVSERAHVTVPELRNGGKAITAAVNAGGNDVKASNIRLEISNPDAVLKLAREAAVEEATTKAKEYAAATGQTLGDVLSLREVSPATRPSQPYAEEYRAADLAASKTLPIRAGEHELKVTVAIVWEFS